MHNVYKINRVGESSAMSLYAFLATEAEGSSPFHLLSTWARQLPSKCILYCIWFVFVVLFPISVLEFTFAFHSAVLIALLSEVRIQSCRWFKILLATKLNKPQVDLDTSRNGRPDLLTQTGSFDFHLWTLVVVHECMKCSELHSNLVYFYRIFCDQ